MLPANLGMLADRGNCWLGNAKGPLSNKIQNTQNTKYMVPLDL